MAASTATFALLATLAGTTPDLRLTPPMEAPRLVDPKTEQHITLFDEDDEDTADPWVVVGASSVIVALLALWAVDAWWSDGLQPFTLRDTGSFEEETYAGGADKVGHAYANYLLAHSVSAFYEALGMSRTNASWWGAIATFLVANWVELIDGFTDFGFEHGDVIANSLGAGLGLVTRLSPTADSIVGFRIAYTPSRDFLENDKSVLKWINDYSGMTFYLDVKAKGVAEALDRDPGLWRYAVGGIAFGTDQYSPVRRNELRRRNLGIHAGLSLSEILRVWGDGDEGVETIATIFDYYAVPFLGVTLMKDLNSDDWFVNFGVSNRAQAGL